MDNVDSWRKLLKVFAIIMMVVDALVMVMGGLVAASVIDPYWLVDDASIAAAEANGIMNEFVIVVGVSTVVMYLVQLICTAFVYRGAKDPSKMMAGMVLYGLLSVYEVYILLTNGFNDGTSALGLTTFIIFAGTIIVYRSAKKN